MVKSSIKTTHLENSAEQPLLPAFRRFAKNTLAGKALLAVLMNKIIFIALFAGLTFSLTAQDIPYIKADQITRWKNSDSDTVYVLNFWATWCAPCVAELPDFEKITSTYAGKPVKVILISTDFRRDVDTKVKPFVKRKKLNSTVMFMNETTPNDWIDTVSTEWTGAIPATLIVSKSRGFERFFEKKLHFEEIQEALEAALNL